MNCENEKYTSSLQATYESKGIFNKPLCTQCTRSQQCWEGASARMLPDAPDKDGLNHTHIYLPWIGSDYEKLKLMVIAINMNNYGGHCAQEWLIKSAQDKLLSGSQRLFADSESGYTGSLLHHRVGCYIASLRKNIDYPGLQIKPFVNGYADSGDISASFNFVAMTNIIKCSLKGDRSKPTQAMWGNCSRHILKDEIKILKPEKLLLVGNQVFTTLNYYVFDEACKIISDRNNVKKGIAKIDGKTIDLFVVKHPSAPGGADRKIIAEMAKSYI